MKIIKLTILVITISFVSCIPLNNNETISWIKGAYKPIIVRKTKLGSNSFEYTLMTKESIYYSGNVSINLPDTIK